MKRLITPLRYAHHKYKPWYVNLYRRIMRKLWKAGWIDR